MPKIFIKSFFIKMPEQIYIAICSRKFNKSLKGLLRCIKNNIQNYNNFKCKVLIVFNTKKKIDIYQSLEIKELLQNIKFKILYEKQIGISHVRNKAIHFLKNQNFDFGCFLDDDCKIDENYFSNHLHYIKKKKCSIVGGPQLYLSKHPFFRVFERNHLNDKKLKWVSTNNVFFKKKILNNNIIFSNKVAKYGYGEDQLFFTKMTFNGEKIFWNNNPVYEIRQKHREKISWFFNRSYKYGLTGYLIDKSLYGKYLSILINFMKIFYYLFLSLFLIIFIPIKPLNIFFLILSYILRATGRLISLKNFND